MAGGATTDFSERNMAYMHGFDWGYDDGGNSEISEAYLSRFSGPINESDDPYSLMGQSDSVTGPVQDYVREMARLSSPTEIKTALMNSGAVETFIYFDPYNSSYYNQSNYTYCYQGSEGTDHGVTIVGWDDNKVTSGGTGAWLIKNSWGTTTSSWGGVANANGYFWLSYADTYGGKTGEIFYNAVPASTYAGIYDWSKFGDVTELNTPYGLNAYTATSNSSLKSVGFFTEADGASYTVRVYRTFSGGTLSNMVASTTGTETYAGYHTIDLPTSVALTSGSNFYVYVGITNGGSYPMATDVADSGYDSASTASPGQSYYSFDGNTWTDTTTWNSTANFCINALVQPQTQISATPGTPDLANASDTGISNTDNITKLDNSAANKTLQFLVSGTVSGATVTIYAGGTAIGSATASGASTTVTTNGSYDLVDGSQSITARQTESGKSESADSTALSVTIDTAAPTAPAAPDLEAGSDSGISNTDNITNHNTPTFDVSVSSGTYWRIYRGGTLVSQPPATGSDGGVYKGPGAASETLLTQADGTYSYTARAVDAAGNESGDSTALSVTIDTTAPAAPALDLEAASDLGPSNNDNITSDNTPTFDVTGAASNYWRIYRGGTLVSQPPTLGSDLGVYKGPGNGSETLPTQADAVYTYTARAVDAAGNESGDGAGLSVTIDTVSPTVTSSIPSTPGPTNLPSVTFTVVFGEAVSNVTVDDFQLTTTGTATGSVASVDVSSGTSFNVTVNTITGEGTLRLDLKSGTDVQDTAGNIASAYTGGSTVTISRTDSHTKTWDGGGGTDKNWMTAANWAFDVAPVAGDRLVFTTALTTLSNNNFPADTVFDGITFSSGGVTLTGNSVKLTPAGGVAIDNVLGQNLINLPIASDSTGTTVVEAGTLQLGLNAQGIVLNGGGTDIRSGKLVFSYSGGSTPAGTILSLLTASYDGGAWDTGKFRSTTAIANGTTLGWNSNARLLQVTVMATIPGDFNLDGTADSADKSIWLANAWTGTAWAQGDANYDGVVDGRDRDILLANISRSINPSPSPVVSQGDAAAVGSDDQASSSSASQATPAAGSVLQAAHDAVFSGVATDPDSLLDGELVGEGLVVG